MKKIAYIEFNLVHDEIQPIFQYIASKLGYIIDFYIPEINKARNVFCRCDNVNVFPLAYLNPHDPCNSPPLPIEDKWTDDEYDCAILGTGEPFDRLNKFNTIKITNKYVIAHNYNTIYQRFAFKIIVLADFLLTNLRISNGLTINPMYCGNININDKPNNKVFCIQGNFHSKKRNYNSLINAVLKLKYNGFTPNDFIIEIVGRYKSNDVKWHNFGTEGASFEQLINKLGICKYFITPDKEYTYPEYYDKMINSRYILPLIDETHQHKFFTNSCTSSINMGTACLCIPVINSTLAKLYHIDFGYQYKKDNVYDAMKQAIVCIDDNDILIETEEYRQECLTRSVNNIKNV